MKQYWQNLVKKIDAMSLRERALIFAMGAGIILALVNATVLDSQFARQKLLSQKVRLEQDQINAIQAEIQQKVAGQRVDPDAGNKARMRALGDQLDQMHLQLAAIQKGLVAPERMTGLLDDILRRNGRLHLVSLKSLPPTYLSDPAETTSVAETKNPADKANPLAAEQKDKPRAPSPINSVYKHGVEIVLRGNYLDMTSYMSELEAMPWQLFWGRAKLHVDEYPSATLTLTLFTLSLDKKWLNL